MARAQFLECGKIQNTHGVRGLVRAESYCDSPAILAGLPVIYFRTGDTYLPRKVLHATRMGELVLLQLEGVEDMDAAALLKNQVIFAAREDIPMADGAYFLADLPGLPVVDAESGRTFGTVGEVREVGARRMLTVETPGGERLLPMVPAFIRRVDVDEAVFVTPIPGLLEDEN